MVYFLLFSAILIVAIVVGYAYRDNHIYDSSRVGFLDVRHTTLLRGLAILMVVWGHFGNACGILHIQFIPGVGVSLFLLLSGYGLSQSIEKKGLKYFWTKRLLFVFLPFAVVTMIGCMIKRQSIRDIRDVNWFIPYLAICYALFYAVIFAGNYIGIIRKKRVMVLLVLFGLFCVFEIIRPMNPDVPYLRARQMFSFPIGALISERKNQIEKKMQPLYIAPLFLMGTGMLGFTQIKPLVLSPILYRSFSVFTVLLLALSIICADYYFHFTSNTFLYLCGICSYEIFLVHIWLMPHVREYGYYIVILFLSEVCLATALLYLIVSLLKKPLKNVKEK